MIRVFVVDDHAVVREGVKRILEDAGDLVFADEASSGPEALDKLRRKRCDVVVLDISLPGRSGLEVLKQLKQEYPELPVLVLSMQPEDQYATRVLRLGADGYVTKESIPEQLVQAIRKVAQRGKYVSPSLAERLAVEVSPHAQHPLHMTLSDRELEVLTWLASGHTVTEISEKLSLSVKTISTHRVRVLDKLHLHNTSQLIRYALEHQLVK